MEEIKKASPKNPKFAEFLKSFNSINEPSASLSTSFVIPEIKFPLKRANVKIVNAFIQLSAVKVHDDLSKMTDFN